MELTVQNTGGNTSKCKSTLLLISDYKIAFYFKVEAKKAEIERLVMCF